MTTLTTQSTPFAAIPALGEGVHLLGVRPGVPIDVAVRHASAQLHVGLEAMRAGLCDQDVTPESGTLWSAYHTMAQAAAIIEAVPLLDLVRAAESEA